MRLSARDRARFYLQILCIGIAGLAAIVYMLANQRVGNPFADTYRVSADLPSADGVVAGLGQPVNVAGVQVGAIVEVERADGAARLTLELKRKDLPAVYRDAHVDLDPITPLEDMQLNLEPGKPSAGRVADGFVIPVGRNSSPVPLANLLEAFDADTRAYVQTLLSSVAGGVGGRSDDLRKTLRAFGPTTRQARAITSELAGRRAQITRLVGNLAKVTRAASQDRELASLVVAGDQTLNAIARQDEPLRAALDRLPGTLGVARTTLARGARFSRELGPALVALQPAVDRLPGALAAMKSLSASATPQIARDIRPFVRQAQPLARSLSGTVPRLTGTLGPVWDSLQSLRYLFNTLAYNPPGDDEGNLFWAAWAAHNTASVFGATGDAHGGMARASVLVSCDTLVGVPGDLGRILQLTLGSSSVCPGTSATGKRGG